uniref:Zgc:153738 n=1 Tax=Sinocyclocheilus grahami TaxID=75366 RepID=A0A672LMY3_SINGR
IRQVLDSVMGRVLELKNEIVEKEFSEYHYMDDIIQDLRINPEDLEIPIPRYFIRERNKVLQDRERMFAAILNQMDVTDNNNWIVLSSCNAHVTLERAIKVIQVAERARQGRLRAKFMREIHRDSERQRKAEEQEAVSTDQAVVCFQKVKYKLLYPHKIVIVLREDKMIFLGMAIDPKRSYPCQTKLDALNNEANRQIRQDEHEDDYQKSIGSLIYQLREVEGSEMKETMQEQIRQLFIECRDATGSALIIAEKTPEELAEELAAKEEEDANKKPKGKEETKEKGKN